MISSCDLVKELRKYLDTQLITSDNIGQIRRSCFVPWDSKWNSIVRYETAAREKSVVKNENGKIIGMQG